MAVSMRNSVIIVTVMLGCLTHSETSLAQSIDKCMSASVSDALQVCKGILESGSRNADVYWTLSSALHQDGQQAQAMKTLDAAIQLHPGNTKLLSLKKIISSDINEKERIEESAKINQRLLDIGTLKISCLTKSGKEAISACKRRLELTKDEGERMRARLAELESEKPDKPPPDPPDEPVEIVKPDSIKPDSELLAAEAYKTLVAKVQRLLNELGFNTGLPDGVPGKMTISALSEFYNAIDAPVNSSITSLTIEDLDDESRKLEKAVRLINESYRELEQGEIRLAKERLNDARLASKLVKVPSGLEQAIRSLPVDIPVLESAKETTTVFPPKQKHEQSTVPTPLSDRNLRQFNELMGQINVLHDQITRKQAGQALALDRLRSVF